MFSESNATRRKYPWYMKGCFNAYDQPKNHTHVKKVGHTSEFIFGIYWWTLRNPKKKNFGKMKKKSGNIIILHKRNKNHNHMRYSLWDMEWDKIFCHFGPYFALLPHYWPKNLNLEKYKKTPGDIILLHMCTINKDKMMYGSWDIKCKGQSFLSVRAIFCPLTFLTNPKIKILKK